MKFLRTTLWATALILLTAGCASHPRKVDCEGHLRPINAPAPVTSGGTRP